MADLLDFYIASVIDTKPNVTPSTAKQETVFPSFCSTITLLSIASEIVALTCSISFLLPNATFLWFTVPVTPLPEMASKSATLDN